MFYPHLVPKLQLGNVERKVPKLELGNQLSGPDR